MIEEKRILDPCCGSRMFWFNKEHPEALYCDIRELDHVLIWENAEGKDKRYITVRPDVVADVTDLPFNDGSFWHIVLDPPHIMSFSENAWMGKKYGILPQGWESFITEAFNECWRVLKKNGTLNFKWNETQVTLKDVLKAIPQEPLYGQRGGRTGKTIWLSFIK